MTYLLIDGYNLLPKTTFDSREDLIASLSAFGKARSNMDITVYFDGTHQGTRFGDQEIIEGIRIIYTPLHETADDHIIAFLDENPHKDMMVVTSDRKIQNAAARNMSTFVESHEFAKKITQRQSISPKTIDEEDPYRPKRTTKKKGNPRRKSKKQKRKERDLKKL